MSEQPEALRIADWIESIDKATGGNVPDLYTAASAELRKLHDENFVLASGQCLEGGPWGDEGGTPYCKLKKDLRRLHEVNQELVEALTQAVAWIDGDRTPINALTNARAALAKARGEG